MDPNWGGRGCCEIKAPEEGTSAPQEVVCGWVTALDYVEGTSLGAGAMLSHDCFLTLHFLVFS